MRPYAFALTFAAALAMAAPALAQSGMGGLGAPRTVEENVPVGALERLPKAVRDWIAEESVRQAKSPDDLDTLDESIETALGADLDKGAQRNRMNRADLVSAIRYFVVRGAGRLLDDDLKLRRQSAGETPSDDQMLTIEAVTSNRNRLRALEEQANRRLTLKAAAFID